MRRGVPTPDGAAAPVFVMTSARRPARYLPVINANGLALLLRIQLLLLPIQTLVLSGH
jgi:hypothetical protein